MRYRLAIVGSAVGIVARTLCTASEVLEMEAPRYWYIHMQRPNAGVKGRDRKKNCQPDIFGKFTLD